MIFNYSPGHKESIGEIGNETRPWKGSEKSGHTYKQAVIDKSLHGSVKNG